MNSISIYILRIYNKWKTFLLTSANRKRLKAAFKVWLICAILKAFAIFLAWIGLAAVLGEHFTMFRTVGADVGTQHLEELVKFFNSSRLICHLAKQAGNRKHSTDDRAIGLSSEQLFIKAISEGRISDRDVGNFISFGKYLEGLVLRVNGRGEALKHSARKTEDNKEDLLVFHQIRPKVLRTLSKALGSSVNRRARTKRSKAKFLGIHNG